MTIKVILDGELLHPSEFLAAVEFKGQDATLTIKRISKQDLKMVGGKTERKPVIEFEERPKKLVVNKTNASSIAEMYGADARQWVGKRITLYPTKAKFGNQTVDAIRVREKVPPPKQGSAPKLPPDQDYGEPATTTAPDWGAIQSKLELCPTEAALLSLSGAEAAKMASEDDKNQLALLVETCQERLKERKAAGKKKEMF